uniref:Uncharacterized protein n=1 Tax=Glossina brevipalpis TaxID=37001 RepID=A0A1A9WKG8_9MUSC
MKKLVILIIIYCYFVVSIWSDCYFRFPEYEAIAPSWKKKIADDWFEIPYINMNVKLQNGEVIKGYCPTNFREISYTMEDGIKCGWYDFTNPFEPIWMDENCPSMGREKRDLFGNNKIEDEIEDAQKCNLYYKRIREDNEKKDFVLVTENCSWKRGRRIRIRRRRTINTEGITLTCVDDTLISESSDIQSTDKVMVCLRDFTLD